MIARGPDEALTLRFLQGLADRVTARAVPGVRVQGPAPAPVAKIQHLYRFHLRLFAPTPRPLQVLLHDALATAIPPGGVELAVDVDPMSLL